MLKIGHRGAAGYAPENTLRSMRKALELGLDYIEFDVQVTKDGALAVIHDDMVDRTTDATGFVSEKTLAELQTLDAGAGEKIPTLQEVLDTIDHQAKVLIDMSGFLPVAEKVAAVIQIYVEQKSWQYDDFLVLAYHHPELKKFKNLLPQVPIVASTCTVPLTYAKFAEELGATFVATESTYMNDDAFVKDAHARGMKFILYTINDPAYVKRFEPFGIDGIISDMPDVFED